MKYRNVLYIFLMIMFTAIAYLFFDRGINAISKLTVSYKENNDVIYKVYLNDKTALGMNKRYTRENVDYIDLEFDYNIFYSKVINGYYKYNVVSTLYAYTDNINESIWSKKDTLITDKIIVIDNNDTRDIDISDKVYIDYNKYIEELNGYNKEYKQNAFGYLEVVFNITQDINFNGINGIRNKDSEIRVIIPLSYESFKINVNRGNNRNSYYEFSNQGKLNYLLLILGSFSLATGISFLALTIRDVVLDYDKKIRYKREFRHIVNKHRDVLIKIKRFYNKKDYNIVYVDSFDELLNVYEKVKTLISYREIKKNSKAMFLLIDDDNVWIYMLDSKNMK